MAIKNFRTPVPYVIALMFAVAGNADAVIVNVSTAAQLQVALSNANPGDNITLNAGTYEGVFVATRNGTPGNPIRLTGTVSSILKNTNGYGFSLQADYWKLRGFVVSNSSKGVVLDGANHNVLDDLTITNIGDEAVHLRAITVGGVTKFSSNNVVQYSTISNTGLASGRKGYGEAIYIGSATNHWPDRSNNNPDTSNNNCIYKNILGPNISAEGVDIKEGTTGGMIVGNTYYAAGISGENAADSFIDAKGNGYMIYGNTVDNSATKTSLLLDGFQTHQKYNGFGNNNIFQKNKVYLYSGGYGFNVDSATTGNIICADNVVTNANGGTANIGLSQCAAISMPVCPDVLNN